MNRVLIKKENYEIVEGYRLPVIECPGCGNSLLGVSSHEIEENGNVNASVVCPYKDCGFHEFVVLEDWNGGKINRV